MSWLRFTRRRRCAPRTAERRLLARERRLTSPFRGWGMPDETRKPASDRPVLASSVDRRSPQRTISNKGHANCSNRSANCFNPNNAQVSMLGPMSAPGRSLTVEAQTHPSSESARRDEAPRLESGRGLPQAWRSTTRTAGPVARSVLRQPTPFHAGRFGGPFFLRRER